MRKLQLIYFAMALPMMANAQYKSDVWSPDNGDGTYTNPVINADYSDPDVCVGASGEDYYLTASSFQCIPGLPILHSKDLVNWEIINYAVKELEPKEMFDAPSHGNGVWAPSIRYHAGEYYIYWGDPDNGVFMVKTRGGNPAGEWEKPLLVIPGKGMIDTTPLWDDDGRCYLVNGWANSRNKFASLLTVRELSADGTKAISDPVIVFDGNGTENRTCEGPKFYKRDGWYWIMCPAGGVPTGFQLAMRSKSPYGPYEHKIVLAQGKTAINGPHQGGWIHTKYGEDWFLHFQDKEAYGRVVHLNPVDWTSGWPMMGKKGEPVTTYRKPKSISSVIVNPVESDEFNTPSMGLQWQWHANYNQAFGMPTAFGTFRIYTYKLSEGWKNFWEVPNLFLQKTPADAFTVTAKLRMTSKADGQFGGLIMMGLDYSALVVKRVGEQFQLIQMTCKAADKGTPQTEQLIATLNPTAIDKIDYKPGIHEDIYLRMKVADSKLHFAWSSDGKKFTDCGETFQMKEGKWIGAKFGFIAAETDPKSDRGWVDADWIRITKMASSFADDKESNVVSSTDDKSQFVTISDVIPDAIMEIRYFSTYNFVGARIDGYEEPTALLTKQAADSLKAVSDDVIKQGYRLKIYDAYRPQMGVDNFVRWAADIPDTLMKPYFYPDLDKSVLFDQMYIMGRSGHTRGSTIDLTLFDMATEKELDMGGTFDWFGPESHPDFCGNPETGEYTGDNHKSPTGRTITPEQFRHRMILRSAMLRHGFKPLDTEWWHFTLDNEPFPDTYFTFPVRMIK